MAIGYNTKDTTGPSTSNPVTLSYTCGNYVRLLILMIISEGNVARTTGTPTYGGINMTQAGSTVLGSAECTAELWYLINPPTGAAKTINVPNAATSKNLTLMASSYTGTSGISLFGTPVTTNTDTTTPSLTINSVPAGGLVVAALGHGYKDPPSARSHTVLYEADPGAWTTSGQYGLISSTGNITCSWTLDGSASVAMVMAAFEDVVNTNVVVCATDFT